MFENYMKKVGEGSICTLPYFHCTYKNGLQNPVDLQAENLEDAKKRAFAHHLKNSEIGYEQKYNIDKIVESVTLIED